MPRAPRDSEEKKPLRKRIVRKTPQNPVNDSPQVVDDFYERQAKYLRTKTPEPKAPIMTPKGTALLILTIVALIFGLIFAFNVSGTVESGSYVIKQAAVSGEVTAIMKPGMYSKMFGSITEWPVAETFYFTKDVGHAADVGNDAIEVRFNDGAVCTISGTCRVDMPRAETDAVSLVTKFGYRTHQQVEQKLILPIIRRSLIMTANLMSSKESYSDRRPDFIRYAWDQIANGVYQTKDEQVTEIDPLTQKDVTKTRKTILVDEKGKTLRENNPLEGTGITLSIFEIKDFGYDPSVTEQIRKQQASIMAVQIARAEAQKAAQDSLTAKALGEAVVVKAEYEELEKKTRAEVQAKQIASVATIEAQKLLDVASKTKETAMVAAEQGRDVAKVDLEAATLTKQKTIELATGEAQARTLILAADGALDKKLAAYTNAQQVWAEAYAQHRVPQVVMGSNGASSPGSTSEVQNLMDMLTAKTAKDLALDMAVPAKTDDAIRVRIKPGTNTVERVDANGNPR